MKSFRNFARTAGAIAGLSALGIANAAPMAESLGGTVRVNQGSGFTVLQGTTAVKPGDTIMADPKGNGRLVYNDGCSINVKPGAIVTVAEVSPCSLKAQASDDRDRKEAGFLPLGEGTGLLIAGGVAAVGTGVGLALGSGGGGGGGGIIPFIPPKPASP